MRVASCWGTLSSYMQADQDLNRAYQSCLRHLETADQTKLRDAQRSWLAYRDNECTFEASEYVGGTMYPLEYDSCLTELTRIQTKRLREVEKTRAH